MRTCARIKDENQAKEVKNKTKVETILKECVDFLRVRIASPPADIKSKGMRKGGLHQGKGVIKNSQCPGESM